MSLPVKETVLVIVVPGVTPGVTFACTRTLPLAPGASVPATVKTTVLPIWLHGYHPTKPWRTVDGDRNGSHAAC